MKLKSIQSVTLVITLASGLLPFSVQGAAIRLKMGTLAPNNSSYHKAMLTMGEKWRQSSAGAVQLTVFPDGRLGGEADMVGLMQTGSLDAGLLTAVGLAEIEPAVNALQSMPMAFRSLEEVDYVGEKLRPLLEARLLAKGYLVLFWSDSGWVRFFTTSPILRPEDLRKLKIFSWAGNTHEYDLWKSSGFNPVALETAGIAQGLLSRTISAITMPPLFANPGRMDAQARYMLELNWAPLVGAAVVRKKSWDKVPANLRASMLQVAAEAGRDVKAAGRAESDAAVVAMEKRGLKVQKVTPEIEAEWRAVVEKVNDQIRGKIVPADMYDEAQRILKEYRAAQSTAPK
jgi:TRAP-type transport system periplasmic protein